MLLICNILQILEYIEQGILYIVILGILIEQGILGIPTSDCCMHVC